MFGSLGLPELVIILVIVMLIFGANRLPGLARGLGSSIKNFKEGMRDEGTNHKSSDHVS
jgi:sec-independent protein translocase protein TatA